MACQVASPELPALLQAPPQAPTPMPGHPSRRLTKVSLFFCVSYGNGTAAQRQHSAAAKELIMRKLNKTIQNKKLNNYTIFLPGLGAGPRLLLRLL